MNPTVRLFLEKYRIEFIVASLFVVAFAAFTRIGILVDRATAGADASVKYAALMAGLSVIVFLVARISYPKIYKFKILLSGYTLIACVILFFLISTPVPENSSIMGLNFREKSLNIIQQDGGNFSFRFLFTLLNINLLVVILASAYVNYNAGKNSAWLALGIYIFIYLLVLMLIPAGRKSPFVYGFLQTHILINCIITGLTIIFSFFTIEEEHNYGSIIVGLSIMTLYCELFSQNIGQVKFILPLMEIIIIWGMFAHWVNCLHHKAHYDPLLKIYNRQYMDNIIHGIADVRLGKKMSVMMCDIDHFKRVNDTYGHSAGDVVLFTIAQIIRDTALPEGVVCRYGGEEIIVFLRDKTDAEAKAKAEKIRKAVKAAKVKVKSKTIKVTMSIGIGSTKNGLEEIEKTIKKADDCVYKAKKAGRDRVVLD